MKAKIFNLSNCSQTAGKSKSKIRVSKRYGVISFPVPVIEKMKLTEKSRIELINDTEHPRDWYISVVGTAPGFVLSKRAHGKGQPYLVLRSHQLVAELFKSLRVSGESFEVAVGDYDSELNLWPLITAALK